MNEGQKPKRYYVQLPGYQQGELWDEDKFNRNKEALFNDHKDAIVLETAPLSADDPIGDKDAFTVHLPNFPEAEVWDAAKLSRNREQLLKDHPDVEIYRTNQVNYWGDKLEDIYNRINTLKKEREGLLQDEQEVSFDQRNPRSIGGGSINEAANLVEKKRKSPTLTRKHEIDRELDQLYRMREDNPAWQQYWQYMNKGITDDLGEIDRAQKELQKKNPKADKLYREASRIGAGPGMNDPIAIAASDPEYNSEMESYTAARAMLLDAKKAAEAPSRYGDESGLSNFWKGVVDGAPEALSAAQLVRAGLNMHLVDAIKKIQEQEGKDVNIRDLTQKEYFDDLGYLNGGEKELVKAFVKKAEVEAGRQENLSRAYQSGQSAIQSAGYMLDFAMYGGIGDAAAEKVAGNLIKKAGNNAIAKIGAESLYGTVKALTMTPFMPSSYGNFMNNILQFNDAGGVDLSGKAMAKAAGDVIIEVVSETIGSKPLDLIGLPLQKVKFPSWAKAMRSAPIMKALKQAGYNGFFEEMVEEWTGNALRVMTGVDKDALKNFATVDQQLITAGAFAPMSLFGLPVSLAQYSAASKQMKQKGVALEDIIGATFKDDEAKANALKASALNVSEFETPEDFAHHMTDIYQQIVENGGDAAAAYQAVMDYTQAASRYKVMDGVFEEQKDIDRSSRLVELDSQMGNERWHHEGQNGVSFVRILTDQDGNQKFVVAENENGVALVDRQGNRSIMSADELAAAVENGALADSGELFLNDFLDKETQSQQKAEESVRMESERQQASAELAQQAQPGMQVNLGTVEAPDMATIIGVDGGNYIVQKSDGTTKAYSPEDMASMLGIQANPLTDEQITEQEARRELDRQTKREVANSHYVGMSFTMADGQQYSLGRVLYNANEGAPFTIYAKNAEGKDVAFDMSEEEFDAIYIQWMNQWKQQQDVQNNDDSGTPPPGAAGALAVDYDRVKMMMADDLAKGESPETIIKKYPGAPAKLEEILKEVQEEASRSQVDDGTPRDFRGNPLPMRTNKQTGQQVVDGNALWNRDPEAWAVWNDGNPNARVSSKERLEYTIRELNKEIDKDTKAVQKAALRGIDEDEMDMMEAALGQKLERRQLLTSILEKYNLPVAAGQTIGSEQRKEKAERVKAEQQAGFPGIQQRWNEAPKIVGEPDEIRLPNGETIEGHYVLTEADAPTASHDPANGFAMSDGFPVDENGKTVNDRDYAHDKAAQDAVLDKAANYDQRALQTPVIVSADGVVLSGNDRTMASQIAAANNTDKAYWLYLGRFSQKYGFTNEQVSQFQHPRVVFVPDAAMPYNAATFAKFNAEEKKSQSKTEKAVKAGKTLTPESLASLATLVDRFDDINALYNDAEGVDELLNILLAAEVISQEQLAALKDGSSLSGTGMDLLESTLIGAALDEEAVRIAMSDKAIRKSVVSAIAQIITGNTLADYTLRSELADAIQLVANGKRAGEIKFGETVQSYVRQQHLFEDDVVAEATVQMLADAINDRKTSFLKKVLSLYNRDAVESATGQMDLLTGDVLTRDAILRNILQYLGYDTNIIFDTSERAAAAAEPAAAGPAASGAEEEQGPAPVQSNTGSAEVARFNREEAASILEQGNIEDVDQLLEAMSDEEVSEFLKRYETFLPANDALGEAYSRLDKDLHSSDKKVKKAAQAEIDRLEQAQVDAFAPVQEYVDSLIEKYDLQEEPYVPEQEAIEDEIEEDEAEEFEPEEEPKPAKGKKGTKKAGKKEEKATPLLTGKFSEKDLAKVEYTSDEVEQLIYGASLFGEYTSKRTGEKIEIVYADDHLEVYHDHQVRFWVWQKGAEYGDHREGVLTTDQIMRYLKANGFKCTKPTAKKNKYGYWVNNHGVLVNPIRVELPSVRKGWAQMNYVSFGINNSGKWETGASFHTATSGHSGPVSGGNNKEGFDRKSDAIKYLIDAAERYLNAHFNGVTKGKSYEQRDLENLIRALKTKTLPQALLEEGAVSNVSRADITASMFDDAVQGDLFGAIEPEGTVVPEPEAKPKRKRAAKKAAAPAVSTQEQTQEGEEDEAEEKVQFEAEEGTPGNYHWVSERVCTNPTIITLPGEDKFGNVSKVALAEKDGKWYNSVYVTEDEGKGSAWGSPVPTFKSSYIPYASREEAVKKAIDYMRWVLMDRATKSSVYGETFNKTKALIDQLANEELNRGEEVPVADVSEALDNIKRALDTFANSGNYARVVRTLETYQASFDEDTQQEISSILSDMVGSGLSKESKDEMVRRATELYNRLAEPKDFIDEHVIVAGVPSAKKAAPAAYGSKNKVVTTEKYEELVRKMREKLGQLNSGFDPELFVIGVQVAAYHVEAGARQFIDFSRRMIVDLGDAIRPYLKSFYNGARDLPGMERFKKEMDSAADVDAINADSIPLNYADFKKRVKEGDVFGDERVVSITGGGTDGMITTESLDNDARFTTAMRSFYEQVFGEDAEDESPQPRSNIQGLEDMSVEEIIAAAEEHVNEVGPGFEGFAPVKMIPIGSRVFGTARKDSDLDILIEYEGDAREDAVFNLLNEEHLTINGIQVDFFPIRAQESGTMDEWLASHDNGRPVEKKTAENTGKNEDNFVTLKLADGETSITVDKSDYRSFMTPEAREFFAKKAVEDAEAKGREYANPSIAFITYASHQGVVIPADELMALPEFVAAEARIDWIADTYGDKYVLPEGEKESLAARLFDDEHGSAVLDEDGDVVDYTGEVAKEKRAFIVIGRPAAGKSSVFADPLSSEHKARIIDSDIVKPWLPHFEGGYGAGFVQDASTQVMTEAFERATDEGENIVIPKIGGPTMMGDFVEPLLAKGYRIELYFNEVAAESSIMRAAARFAAEGRYLSIKYLLSIGEKPLKTFKEYAEKKIGEYYGRNNENQSLPESGTEHSAAAEGVPVVGVGSEGVQDESDTGAGRSELQSVASDGGRAVIPSGLNSEEKIFAYAEWKNNDVPYKAAPVLVWKSNAAEAEQPKAETPKSNTATVKQVNVEGLLGAVGDMFAGKRGSVKLSEFAEPLSQEEARPATEEKESSPLSVLKAQYDNVDALRVDLTQALQGLTNSIAADWVDVNPQRADIIDRSDDLGFIVGTSLFYSHNTGVTVKIIYDYDNGKYYGGRVRLETKVSSPQGGLQEASRNFPLGTPIATIVEQSHSMEGTEPQETPKEKTSVTIGELGKYTHTKTGKEMTIVRLSGERLSAEEFKRLKARAKELGGYYSSFGSAKGFLFENEEDAIKFNTIESSNNAEEQTDEQTAANSAALVREAASAALQAQSLAEAESVSEREAAEVINTIDEKLEEIDDQLALLGFYKADQDVPFHESYGYMKSAEKKAVKDADRLAKKLAADLGIDVGRKQLAKANIAPAGGDISFRLPLNEGRELYVTIDVAPRLRDESIGGDYGDDLYVGNSYVGYTGLNMSIMYRVENQTATGQDRFGANHFAPYNVSYADLLNGIKIAAKNYLPEKVESQPEEGPVDLLEVAKKQAEKSRKSEKKSVSSQVEDDALMGSLFDDLAPEEQEQPDEVTHAPAARVKPTEMNGYKIGQKVLYTPSVGDRKPQEATIYDFEYNQPVLDTGLAPVLYEVTEWDNIQPLNTEENELPRNDEPGSEGAPADNNRPVEGQEQAEAGAGEEAGQEGGRADTGAESGSGLHTSSSRSLRRVPRLEGQNKRNNRVSKGEVVYPKTPAARFNANIAAIRLLKDLQDSGKQATKEQMAVLRQYTGWGGLGNYFNNQYSSEYRQLQSLLTDEEMHTAEMSINTAYYTPVEVIDAMWDIAKRLGFEGGNVLEGSAGIGSILASMPKSMSESSAITAVEIDKITGGMLELLYPDANVQIKGFEEVNIPNGSVDLAITNVPFGNDIQVQDDKERDLTRKFGGRIHDFCIAKNVRKLAEGGLGIFISTRGTLDNSSKALRQWITNEGGADVIGAFRLNNATFEGTKATSDIIVVRKRVNGKRSPNAIDIANTDITRHEHWKSEKIDHWDSRKHEYVYPEGDAAMEINSYFSEHPENMGGEMQFGFEHNDWYRPGSAGLWPSEKIDQSKRLAKWVKSFSDMLAEEQVDVTGSQTFEAFEESNATKEGQLITNTKGDICISRNGKAVPLGLNAQKVKGFSKAQVLADYDALKDAINAALDYQIKNESDEGLKPLLSKLNKAYDLFARRYGRLNRNVAISFLRNDVDFPAIAAVEQYREKKSIDGKVTIEVKKSGIFNGRVLGAKRVPTPANAKDGVIISINQFGRIDVPFIADALHKSDEEVRNEILASGLGFENPATLQIEVDYEYLSGNVRQKLEYAKAANTEGKYDKNIEALEKAVPADIPAHLIEFSLGSDWLPVSLYTDYAKQKFGTNDEFKPVLLGSTWSISLREWQMDANNEKNRSEGVHSEALRITKTGLDLMLAAMNNTSVVFSRTYKDSDGTSHTETDKAASQAASAKIADMREDFKEWCRAKMLDTPELAQSIQKTYNDTFNAIVPKTISDTFTPEHFEGQVLEMGGKPFRLYPHQAKAVIRATTEPLMMAHEVGSGKTFTLITSAMEMRRLGTAKKPMIVVQNATLGQFVTSAKDLYPNAKILTISEADRTAEGRSAFYAKIKYNDWDMIIIPQSVFEMIPDSEERRRAFVQEKIDEKIHILEQAKAAKDGNVTRQLEKELKDLQYEYENGDKPQKGGKRDAKRAAKAEENAKVKARKQLNRRTDDVSDFDDMGIDALLVDEAHAYKHLGFSTSMQRGVKGVDATGSKKAAGVYLKTRSVFDKAGWKNVVFATGTPISNTAAEIWTFMKYLMPEDVMRQNHIYYFDDFVRNFGTISQNLEFTTSGKFREATRFASYTNLPELIRIWSSVTDTVLTKDAVAAKGEDGKEVTLNDELPKLESWTDEKGETHEGQVRDIYLPQSPSLVAIMNSIRAELEAFEQMSGTEKRENSHIPITMYGLAKMAAIDPRLVDANAPDEPLSKTNRVVQETLKALEDSKRYKGTCALFSDNFRRWDRNGDKLVEGFNVFEEIKRKLVAAGVPEEQIVIMKSGMSTAAKEKIFARVNAGDVRVIMGTTATLGTGVNIQERLFFEAHIDAPNRPMDYTQRVGRILRQGNLHKDWGIPVRVVRFGVEDSLDVTAYQRLSTKSKFINSVMDGKPLIENGMNNRILEEEEEGEFDNPVAVLSGSEYALLKSQAERELRKLRNKQEQHRQDQIYIERTLHENEGSIVYAKMRIAAEKKNLETVKSAFPEGKVSVVTIEGQKAKTPEQIAEAIKERISKPTREFVERMRNDYSFSSQRLKYKLKFDETPVDVTVVVYRNQIYDYEKGRTNTVMSTELRYSCPQFDIDDRLISGGYGAVKDLISNFIEDVATGNENRTAIQYNEGRIARLEADNALMLQRRGKPFEDEQKLKDQEAKVKDYEEKMRAELAEKEAKYAEMAKNAARIDLSKAEVVEDEAGEEDTSAAFATEEWRGNYSGIEDRREGEDAFSFTKRVVSEASDKMPYLKGKVMTTDSALRLTEEEQAQTPGGLYNREKKNICIFAKESYRSADRLVELIFHEAIHEALDALGWHDEQQFINSFNRSLVSMGVYSLEEYRELFADIKARYEERKKRELTDAEIREEMVAFELSLMMGSGYTEAYIEEAKEHSPQFGEALEKLLNTLGYEPKAESIRTFEDYYAAVRRDRIRGAQRRNAGRRALGNTGSGSLLQDGRAAEGRSDQEALRDNDREGRDLEEESVSYALVTDPELIKRLDEGEKEYGFRTVVLNDDGSFSSPKASRLGKKGEKSRRTAEFFLKKWEGAEENPDLATDDGKISLVDSVGEVDYNPYIHIRPDAINKQFTAAWRSPKQVYIQSAYPKSELTSGYKAEKAKLSVGRHAWNNGDLILSRWDKPERIVPWEEVADQWERVFKDTGVTFDIVNPGLLPVLAGRGIEILPPKKAAGQKALEAYNAWKQQGEADARAKASDLYDRYENQDGEGRPWMSEGEMVDAIERELPRSSQTAPVLDMVAQYRELSDEDFAEGRRDFSGGDMADLFDDIISALKAVADGRPIRNRIAYHGSAANFETFELSHALEGEGASAHGYGHYVALNDTTARRYATSSGNYDVREAGKVYWKIRGIEDEMEWAKTSDERREELNREKQTLQNLEDILLSRFRPKNINSSSELSLEESWVIRDAVATIARWGDVERAITESKAYLTPENEGGAQYEMAKYLTSTKPEDWETNRHLYSIEIPEDTGENYIDERKELPKEQRHIIAEALRNLPEGAWKTTEDDSLLFGFPTAARLANSLTKRLLNGEEMYAELTRGLGSKKAASEFLHDAGFVGIKYEGRVDGPCAVIFSDDDVKIIRHDMFRMGELAQPNPLSYSQSIGAKRFAASHAAALCGIDIEFRPSSQMTFGGKPLAGRWIDGKMLVCLEHCRDNDDAVRTVLHEGVGHNGLRRLVGNENMDAFCLDMFRKLPRVAREQIANAAVTEYGGNTAEAVEEYLAQQAEVMDFENGSYERHFWDVVRSGLRRVLAAIGINVPLSQRDVRWLLWQSYNANKQGDLLNEAKRQVVAQALGFTLRQQAEKAEAVQLVRNRLAEQELAPAARIYNKDVLYWFNRLHETWVDKDNAVHKLVGAIEKASGKLAAAFEDVRLALNQQSSKGLAAIEQFERKCWEPMQAAIRALMKEKGCDLKAVERYTMLKHGLERNVVFAERDARAYYRDEHDKAVARIDKAVEEGKIDDVTRLALVAKEDSKLAAHLADIENGTDKKYLQLRKQDYGGLTALFSDFDAIEPFQEGVESEEEYQARVLQARHPRFTYIDSNGKEQVDMEATERAARAEVAEFESGSEKSVDALWKSINAATKFTLKHQYDANMMSRDQYNAVKDMFSYYVPLRGFAENTAEDMYSYYQSDQRKNFNPPLLKAKGRKTEAESPFGYIGSMASSAIAADMKNETKLALYYFVSNRPNDLVNVSEVWYKNTGVDEAGNRIFTPVYPPLNEDLSSEEAKKAYEEWEKGMEEEAKAGFAFKGRKKLDLHHSVIHIDNSQKNSHVIAFKVGGRDMMMYINGNPRAAQAINNELNVEMSTDYQKVFGKILRWFSGINTSYNPEFWLSNAQRDALFALMSVNVKEDSAYNEAFRKNFGSLLGQTLWPGAKDGVFSLMKRLEKGEVKDARLDRLYKEFVENGGVTGYTVVKSNEEWELELRKHSGDEKKAMQAVRKVFDVVQGYGEAIEQMTRFAAYITSREQGKEIKDAVNDAKELTVNFNRKGSGKAISFKEAARLRTKDGKKLTALQKAFVVGASWLPAYGRRFIMFFNASVQGLNAMYKLFKKSSEDKKANNKPVGKMGYWMIGYFALGVVQALIHALVDDDDDYLDIPDYERRNNLLLGGKGVYLKWALPQECRVVYALGDMVVNHALGREPHKGIVGEFLAAASDIAPLNPAGGITAVVPSAAAPVVEVALNRDYKGAKIYNDMRYLSDEERKRTPAFQKAYSGTGKVYVLLSQFANWLSGGDYADAGWLNINPAAVEHILQGATGGAGTTLGKLYRGTVGQVLGEDFAVRNTPFLSRILTINDERYRNAHTTELFDYYKAEAEHTKKLINTYRKNGDGEKLDKIYDSKDYEVMVIYDSYRHWLEYYTDELKATTNKKDRKAIMAEQDAVRKQMIKEISNIK